EKAREYEEMAVEISRRIGDSDGEQRSLCNLAESLILASSCAEAVPLLRAQNSIARRIGNDTAEIIGLHQRSRSRRRSSQKRA
ncbi:MAG: hypothetical protein J2P17_36005, partial [Mycobacterium sp.]|nr:hypothetical protein [Mycobacterium sp.]